MKKSFFCHLTIEILFMRNKERKHNVLLPGSKKVWIYCGGFLLWWGSTTFLKKGGDILRWEFTRQPAKTLRTH